MSNVAYAYRISTDPYTGSMSVMSIVTYAYRISTDPYTGSTSVMRGAGRVPSRYPDQVRAT